MSTQKLASKDTPTSETLIVGTDGVAGTFNANGRAAAASSAPTVMSTEDFAALAGNTEYETVAASATDQVLGSTGAIGDVLMGLLIVPATTGAGTVSIKDGGGSSINVFVSGTLADLTPINVSFAPNGIKCTGVGWKVTTGTNVSAIGYGNFT